MPNVFAIGLKPITATALECKDYFQSNSLKIKKPAHAGFFVGQIVQSRLPL